MKKKLITYLIWNTKKNGGNKIIFEHVNRLSKQGYNLELFTVFGSNPKWFDLKINLRKIQKINFLLKRDILVVTFWPTAFIGLFINAQRKFHFIQAWEEDFYRNIILKKLAKITIKFSYQKITYSDFLIKKIEKYLKKKKCIYKIPAISIDKKIFKYKKRKPIGKTVNILSVVSNYSWYKGMDNYTRLLSKIKKRHKNYKFILATMEKNSISPLVDNFIHNPKPNILAKLYQDADIFLSTSRSEGFFIPGLEAMACGCPVILLNSGGVNEYAKNGINAIIANNTNEIIEKNMIEKLIKNKRFTNLLIKNGLKTTSIFTWKKIISELKKIYN